MKTDSRKNKVILFLNRYPNLKVVLYAVALTFVLELLGRKSAAGAFRFVTRSPLTFICNTGIVLMTLRLAMLAGRRSRFAMACVSVIWLTLGVVNSVVLRYRMTPFSAEDFSMLPSLLRIADNYLTLPMLIGIAAAALALATLVFLLWTKLPAEKMKGSFFRMTARTAVYGMGLYAVMNMGMQTQAISVDFMNLADAYEQYGFAYCFSTSIVDVGISRPEGYSQEMVEALSAKLRPDVQAKTSAQKKAVRPNIIMIQLESFFDPEYLKGTSYSTDPIPCFRALREKYPSGSFTVPVVGAGTSNTEFEILTGMSTDYFGAGEYPYNTVLKERTVEALPHILRENGYTSFALHNNTGTFYNRDTVFSQMGFDQFIPEEYMYDLSRTPNHWAKDNVLPGVMEDCLESTDTPDFIYAITVQSHGRYPQEEVLAEEEKAIRVLNAGMVVSREALEYYVNEVYEVDAMIKDLTDRLKKSDEPTVLVLYGDHLPALGFGRDDISLPSLYQTEYVIWNNFGWERKDENLQAESLGTVLLSEFDLRGGILPAFHRLFDGSEQYSDSLKLLEYDMLYGDGYIFYSMSDQPGIHTAGLDEEEPSGYLPSDMKIGYRDISIDSVWKTADRLYVHGSNFNEFTRIIIDGKPQKTILIDRSTLVLEDKAPESYESVGTGQFDDNLKQLGAAEYFGGSFFTETLIKAFLSPVR